MVISFAVPPPSNGRRLDAAAAETPGTRRTRSRKSSKNRAKSALVL